MRIKNNQGFTLIELIIVCGILAILSAFILTTVNPLAQFQKANDGKRKSNLGQIQRALEAYYQDYKRYPAVDTNYRIKRADNTSITKENPSWPPYMSAVPFDPQEPTRKYVYFTDTNGQSYWFYASLERGDKDPQACNRGNPCSSLSSNGIVQNACGSICNYGVSSPNVNP